VIGRWRACFELLRFPAVFTAIADVMMGYLVTHGNLRPYSQSGSLIIASASMYLAGMALNDVFDVAIDAKERPTRPLPSGRIQLTTAKRLGLVLLAVGVSTLLLATQLSDNVKPALCGVSLAICILLYNGILKRTLFAPLVMGCCRFLNVLLGMSLVTTAESGLPRPWTAREWFIAAAVGLYIVALTSIARSEASSITLQRTVRYMLRGIIVIDAAVVLIFVGATWACTVLALLVPMLLLERWASTT